jgi:hypothetical protein
MVAASMSHVHVQHPRRKLSGRVMVGHRPRRTEPRFRGAHRNYVFIAVTATALLVTSLNCNQDRFWGECVPGAVSSGCTCGGYRGTQICKSDGQWSPCTAGLFDVSGACAGGECCAPGFAPTLVNFNSDAGSYAACMQAPVGVSHSLCCPSDAGDRCPASCSGSDDCLSGNVCCLSAAGDGICGPAPCFGEQACRTASECPSQPCGPNAKGQMTCGNAPALQQPCAGGACASDAASVGRDAHVDPIAAAYVNCSPRSGDAAGCPVGYVLTQDPFNEFLCCPVTADASSPGDEASTDAAGAATPD